MGVRRILERWATWFPWYQQRAREAELARELRDHLELEAEEQRGVGMPAEEAAHAANRALGNVMRIEEDVRDLWRWRWLEERPARDNDAEDGGTFVDGFGIVALVLAAIGIYGVLAFTTRQRTRQIGVRMALGAKPRDVCALVLARGARLALPGIAIGLLAPFVLTRGLSGELLGASPTDPLTYAGVALLLCSVGLLACAIPARRALRVNPAAALRNE